MSTYAFSRCIDLLDNTYDELSQRQADPTLGLHSLGKINKLFIDPFKSEFEDDLLRKKSSEQKTDMIKVYLLRLMKTRHHQSIIYGRIKKNADGLDMDKQGGGSDLIKLNRTTFSDLPSKASPLLKFRHGCNILYNLLIDELQKFCYIFDIPFTDICIKTSFPVDTINLKYDFWDKKRVLEKKIDLQEGDCEKLQMGLKEFGFYNLPLVIALKESSRAELIDLLCSHDVPYKIAMLDYLDFINYFLKVHDHRRTVMYKQFGELFCVRQKPVSARTIQGNINDLRKGVTNRDPRYTASLHSEEVKKHYQTLK